MARKIDYKAKSDHDLLILAVSGINEVGIKLDTLNGTVKRHEHRITVLEVTEKTRWKPNDKSGEKLPRLPQPLLWVMAGLGGLGAFVGGVGFVVGKAFGWW